MRGRGGSSGSSLEAKSVLIARAFFHAATKLSDEDEDILPQEDGDENKLSVYYLFSELFPEHVVAKVLPSTHRVGLRQRHCERVNISGVRDSAACLSAAAIR
jgi:hypothetical protein